MKFDIHHIAKLANISLKKDEKDKLKKQLEDTLNYISNLSKVNTEKTSPTGHVTGFLNVVREDSVSPSLSQEEALKNTKEVKNGFFKVKGILKNE